MTAVVSDAVASARRAILDQALERDRVTYTSHDPEGVIQMKQVLATMPRGFMGTMDYLEDGVRLTVEPGNRQAPTELGAPVIEVAGARVEYRPFIDRNPTIKRQILGRGRRSKTVVALDDVYLSIRQSEAFGIVGRNGAGKSTLLTVMNGTLPPDTGTVDRFGHDAALLALGLGFNRALSGRRNVYLGAMASGLRKREVDEIFDDIVDYAELGDAIDRPVKTYSSGMYSRLAFSVAIHTAPDILLMDELMSVGDAKFKLKSKESMSQILENAGTIVVVSHGLNWVRRTCDRVAWLDGGRIKAVGGAKFVVDAYRAALGLDDSKDDGEQFGDDDDDD